MRAPVSTPGPRRPPAGKVIVVGDLSLDSVAHTPMGRTFDVLERGGDATVLGSVRMLVGGTAYLFSQALRSITDSEPVILAGVGDDLPGRSIRAALGHEGLTTDGVVDALAPTATYGTTYFDHGQRFMICPTDHAAQHYDAADAKRITDGLADDPVRLVWISGYSLIHHRDPDRRLASIAHICRWARERGVPIALDLVPHAFSERVGTIEDVVSWLGPLDAIVVELDTAVTLAGRPELVGSTEPAVAATTARMLGSDRHSILVQYRSSLNTYRQTILRAGSLTEDVALTEDHPIHDGQLRGIGDRLAVFGLCELGLIDAASPSVTREEA